MIEWGVPFTLVTAFGTIDFNDRNESSAKRWILDPTGCSLIGPPRSLVEDRPQENGSIVQRSFRPGMSLKLTVEYWVGGADCGVSFREAHDELMGHVAAMLWQEGTLTWEPTGFDDALVDRRQLRNLRWTEQDEPDIDDAGRTKVTYGFRTRYPYEVDETLQSTAIADGATATITNEGNTDYMPLIRIDGASSGFTITNADVIDDESFPAQVIYDSSLAGGEEFDFFEDSGPVQGLDIINTDFFPIVPGGNDISVTGASITVFHRNAWAG
jgi:hypothetical protein